MNLLETYLKKLNEKEWDEDDKWKEQFDKDLLRSVISKNSETGEEEINVNRHTIQPALLNLIKNAGGDYKGRTTTRNSKHGDFSGIDYILKKLPSDWEDKLKKYIQKIAKTHNEE
jgi:predicted transcriptional regulator